MKMNYRLIRNAKGKRARSAAALVFVALLLTLFHFSYPPALREALHRVSAPVWRAERFVRDTTVRLFLHLSSKEALIRENETLQQKLAEEERLLLNRELLASENAFLKETLGRHTGESRILAAILAAPPRSPYDTVILDAGSTEGVSSGDDILSGGTILGTVVTVFTRTAVAELFSTAGVKTPVLILHEGRAVPVEAEGAGGGVFVATLPRELLLATGDAVVMPSAGPLRFATVEAVESEPSDSFQTVYFKNPVSVGELRFVEVRKHTERTRTKSTEQTQN